MENKEFIEKFLDTNQPIDNSNRRSTLIMALKGARELSGRNILTGIYEYLEFEEEIFDKDLYHTNMFLGIASYLIILEQIGLIFQKKGFLNIKKITNAIQLALENFSSIDEPKIKAIRSLRNSLAHNFGLTTGMNRSLLLSHKFVIDFSKDNYLIELPTQDWNGDFSDKNDNTSTKVNLTELCNLIENVISNVKNELEANNIDLIIPLEEIKARFTIL